MFTQYIQQDETDKFPKGYYISLVGCYNKIPQTGWLKQQNFIGHSFGTWIPKIKVLGGIGAFWELQARVPCLASGGAPIIFCSPWHVEEPGWSLPWALHCFLPPLPIVLHLSLLAWHSCVNRMIHEIATNSICRRQAGESVFY